MEKVLIIGSGGREHALGWKLAQSPHVTEVVYAPGNGGTAREQKGRNVSIELKSVDRLIKLVLEECPDLTVVGPEAPLAAGLVDALLEKKYHRVIGPTKAAAQLEASKIFSYQLNEELGIPQARAIVCEDQASAAKAVVSPFPKEKIFTKRGGVLKADYLAAGKGVVVCDSTQEALEALCSPFWHNLQKTGILVSERLFGEEFSMFALSDGEHVVPLHISFQDHKRRDDGDKGPNTGGMGAYGPAPVADVEMVKTVSDIILTPIVQRMQERGTPYRGIIYAGMMMTEEGLNVLEYNVRFGDPECQPAMMLLEGDLYEIFDHMVNGTLDKAQFSFIPGAACAVVMAAQGYPEKPLDGFPIYGLEKERTEEIRIFHARTKQMNDNFVAAGGRILGVTAYAHSGIKEATERAYEIVRDISSATGDKHFHFRTDIALRALQR